MSSTKVFTIVGMGSGNGYAITRRFAREGFKVVMISRTESSLRQFQNSLLQEGFDVRYVVADAGRQDSLKNAFQKIKATVGDTDVLVYNAASLKMQNILNENFSSLVADFKVNVAGALTATQAVLPAMEKKQQGTILFTGGGFARDPNKDFGALSIGKAALRNLAGSLFKELKARGIHAATVTICGYVNAEDPKYNPDAIAENYWLLHTQSKEMFDYEIVY